MSSSYYSEVHYVPGTNHEVAIFRIAKSKKRNWYARIRRHTSKGGYYRRTLRTESKDIAMKEALHHWHDVRRAEKKGVNLARRSNFESLVFEWLDSRLANGYSASSTRSIRCVPTDSCIPVALL